MSLLARGTIVGTPNRPAAVRLPAVAEPITRQRHGRRGEQSGRGRLAQSPLDACYPSSSRWFRTAQRAV